MIDLLLWRFSCLTPCSYAPYPDGYHAAVRSSQVYANRARSELNIEEPTIENLQTLLLLSLAFFAMGKGRRAYMMLCKVTIHSRWVMLTISQQAESEQLLPRNFIANAPILPV